MKYRTDFVTNSSSSNFGMAIIQILAGTAGALLFGSKSASGLPPEADAQSSSGDENKANPYYLETAVSASSLLANDRYYIWLYARVCSRSEKDDPSRLSADIFFSKGGPGGDFLKFIDFGMTGGFKCVCVVAAPPAGFAAGAIPGEAPGRSPDIAEIVASAQTPAGMIRGTEVISLQFP